MIRKILGAGRKQLNKIGGSAQVALESIGKSADEIEEIGKRVGKEVADKNAAITKRVNAYDAYKNTLKEAKMPTEAATEATVKMHYGREKTSDGYKYYKEQVGADGTYGKRNYIDSQTYGQTRGRKIADIRQSNPSYDPSKNYSWDFTMEEIAESNAKSGMNFDGIPGWAKGAGLVAAGGIAGSVLFGEDDYDE